MTPNQILMARSSLGLAAGVVSVFAVSSRRLQSVSYRTFDRLAWGALAGSRLGLYVLAFFILKLPPRGDIVAYYLPESENVMKGLLPYRDYPSSYAPLHAYFDGIFSHVWDSALALILLAICVELLVLPLWLVVGRAFLTEREVRLAATLYVTSAVSLQFVTIDGQDNVIIALLLVLGLYAFYRGRVAVSGALMGLGVAMVKFLPLLYMPVYFLVSPRRWRFAGGALLVAGPVYALFGLLHAPLLQPLTIESGMRTAGDLPFLIESIAGIAVPPPVWDGLLLVLLGYIFLQAGRAAQRSSTPQVLRLITYSYAALTLALLLLSKKSWPPYLMLVLFPICLVAHAEGKVRATLFAAFSWVAVVEHSYWASVLLQLSSASMHAGLAAGERRHWIFLGLQVLLLSGYGWLLMESIGRIKDCAVREELPEHGASL